MPFETIRIAASPDVDPKRVRDVVVIPGNPGVPAFYETYASRLWSELDGAANIEIPFPQRDLHIRSDATKRV